MLITKFPCQTEHFAECLRGQKGQGEQGEVGKRKKGREKDNDQGGRAGCSNSRSLNNIFYGIVDDRAMTG